MPRKAVKSGKKVSAPARNLPELPQPVSLSQQSMEISVSPIQEPPTSTILAKHPYLPQIIEVDAATQRFKCKLCSSHEPIKENGEQGIVDGALSWLKPHLSTQSHFKFTPIQERESLTNAKNALGRQLKAKAPEPASNKPLHTTEERKEFLPMSRDMEANFYLDGIIKDCIGETLKEQIYKDMERSPYSLLIDGSSDIYGQKFLGVLVRYLNNEQDTPTTKLLEIIEAGSVSTGEFLYGEVRKIYSANTKLQNKLISICTDNGSNLISSKGIEVDPKGLGLVNRIKQELPHLVHVRDACHVLNLVIEEALTEFPMYIMYFIKGIFFFFFESSDSVIHTGYYMKTSY